MKSLSWKIPEYILALSVVLLLSGCLGELFSDHTRDKSTTIEAEVNAGLANVKTNVGGVNTGAFSGGGIYVVIVAFGAFAMALIMCSIFKRRSGQWRTLFGVLARQVERKHYSYLRGQPDGTLVGVNPSDRIKQVKVEFNDVVDDLGLKKLSDKELQRLHLMLPPTTKAKNS